MESEIHRWDLKTPQWVVATPSTIITGTDAARRFEDRQMIVRLTFNRYRSTLSAVPPHLRPQVPSQDDALTRPKRSWERLVQLWRTNLRQCADVHGGADASLDRGADASLDALTFDLCRALERLD